MDLGRTLLLGLIAGATIVLGLPVARLRNLSSAVRLVLSAVTVGILLFLVWDVLGHAWEPIDAALADAHHGTGGLAPAFGYGALFAGGLAAGLLTLVGYERRVERTAGRGGRGPAGWSTARRTALLIAVGIGLHNFAEGLAIGQSAASGEISLATLLVIGFALHNATEGFGIVSPLAHEDERPRWRFLVALAAIGGGPTVVGTLVGHGFTSDAVSVLFLTLAAGSIIYVIVQLLGVAARARRGELLGYGIVLGMIAGFATDAVVTVAGA